MRDFLNAPNGLPSQSPTRNERVESNTSQSPLVGRTVWKLISFSYFVPTMKQLLEFMSLILAGCI